MHMGMTIGNEVIRIKSSVRYLGIRLDLRLTLLYQIQYSANKAQKIVGQLSRLMANIGGLLQVSRKLLTEVANRIMLNATGKKAGKLTCIDTEINCIAYRVGISCSVRPSRTCDGRYNPCGSTGGRTDRDLEGEVWWKSLNRLHQGRQHYKMARTMER